MTRKTLLLTFLSLLPCWSLFAQQVDYQDVAVIVNSNSNVSQNIGSYFMAARGIPAANLITVDAPLDETVDSLAFQDIRKEVQSQLEALLAQKEINYLVTTKGMPQRVSLNGYCDSTASLGASRCSSFEGEIALILSADSSGMVQAGHVNNPYFTATQKFDRDSFGIFLVSRLDAYTQSEVEAMIDRSGPDSQVDFINGKVGLDYYGITDSGTVNLVKTVMSDVAANMTSLGLNTQFSQNNSFQLSGQSDLLTMGTAYWPYAGLSNLNHTWQEGSFGHNIHGGRFIPYSGGTAFPNEINPADFIADGAASAAGYVFANYFSLSLRIEEMFPRYLDTLSQLNLAESYYAGMVGLSTSGVLYGDPKTDVVPALTLGSKEPTPEIADWRIYPNPASQEAYLEWLEAPLRDIQLIDLQGRVVRRYTPEGSLTRLDLGGLRPGIYLVRIEAANGFHSKKLVVGR